MNTENTNKDTAVKSKKIRNIIIVLGVIIAIFSVGAVEYTSQTGFCNSCHEMNTAFAGWEDSVHQTQHCYGCHTDAGVVNLLKVKVNGLKEVYLHLTTDVNMDKVKSEVPATRCDKCHDMNDKKKYGDRISAFHKEHKELKFDCLTCHGAAGHSRTQFSGFKKEACKQCHPAGKKKV